MRLFVSSPSDVAAERARVDVVAERLNGEFEGLARIEVIRWETGFYTATRSFQEAIDSAIDRMRETDMVVCILWKRIGSELDPGKWQKTDGTPYESGTVLEFETALAVSREQKGAPDVYLFRKEAPITYGAATFEAERAQHVLLDAVWKRWTETSGGHNVAGFQRFSDADEFERQLELCLRQWLERQGIVLRTVWDRRVNGSPFRGLAAFDSEHATVFFGREAPIERAIGKLREAEEGGASFLVILGASGAGKSSFLRAGLVPRATRPGIIPGLDQWRTALVLPVGDPLSSLAKALFEEGALGPELAAGDFATPALLAEAFAGGPGVGIAPVRSALERASRARAQALRYESPRPARLMLAVDQVERLFAESGAKEVDLFAEILRALVAARLASVVVALRSDAYARFQSVPGFVALLEDMGGSTYNLLPPSVTELEDIVKKPIAACYPPLAFESDAKGRSLADRLVADAKGGDALPLLQVSLGRLFDGEEKRGDGVLRAADYPGLDAAVAETAGEVIASVGAEAQAQLPALLTALVGDIAADAAGGASPVGASLDRAEFERGLPSRRLLVEAFVERRLLTTEEADGRVRLRPVHDALLRTWPQAVDIISENAALIRVRHTLLPIADDWAAAEAKAKSGYLLTSPALLAGAEHLLERFGEDLPSSMREFIEASLAADTLRRNAERRRQQKVLAAISAGLVAALILAGLAGWQWRVAERQRAIAQHELNAATQTANGLIFGLVQKFKNAGLSVRMTEEILDLTRKFEEQLLKSGETSPQLRFSLAAALDERAKALLNLGDLNKALAAAEQERAICKQFLKDEPGNAFYQRALSVADNTIGDILDEQGHHKKEYEAYHEGLVLAKALAKKFPGNAERQRDLEVSDNRVGEALISLNKPQQALPYYRDARAIAIALARKNAANNEWQSDLAFSDEKLGDVLAALGQRDKALAYYRDELAIARALAQRVPGNTLLARQPEIADNKSGDVLMALKHYHQALAFYRGARAIAEALSRQDPGNAEWRRDVEIVYNRIGNALLDLNEAQQALAFYRAALSIAEALARSGPNNTEFKNDLAYTEGRIREASLSLRR